MIEAQQFSGPELTTGDFVAVPGLPTVRFEILTVLPDPDGSWTIISEGSVINLPNSERKIWAVLKKDLNV